MAGKLKISAGAQRMRMKRREKKKITAAGCFIERIRD